MLLVNRGRKSMSFMGINHSVQGVREWMKDDNECGREIVEGKYRARKYEYLMRLLPLNDDQDGTFKTPRYSRVRRYLRWRIPGRKRR
jgi:hypothetical protein